VFTGVSERATKKIRNGGRMRTAVICSWLQECPSRLQLMGKGAGSLWEVQEKRKQNVS